MADVFSDQLTDSGQAAQNGALSFTNVWNGTSSAGIGRASETGESVRIPTLIFNSNLTNTAPYRPETPVAKVYVQNRDSVVHVQAVDRQFPNGDTDNSDGSGFFVTADGLLATDYHVVKNATGAITVRMSDGRKYKAKIAEVDRAHDLALLRVEKTNPNETFTPVNLADDSTGLKSGDELVGLGFPGASDLLHVAPGKFHSQHKLKDFKFVDGESLLPGEDPKRTLIVSDMQTRRGNSGGPIFRPSDGKVVGVVGFNTSDMKRSLTTPVEDLLTLLNRVRKIESKPAVPETSRIPLLPSIAPRESLNLPTSWATDSQRKLQPKLADALPVPLPYFRANPATSLIPPAFRIQPTFTPALPLPVITRPSSEVPKDRTSTLQPINPLPSGVLEKLKRGS